MRNPNIREKILIKGESNLKQGDMEKAVWGVWAAMVLFILLVFIIILILFIVLEALPKDKPRHCAAGTRHCPGNGWSVNHYEERTKITLAEEQKRSAAALYDTVTCMPAELCALTAEYLTERFISRQYCADCGAGDYE
jgi:hypothetical protein